MCSAAFVLAKALPFLECSTAFVTAKTLPPLAVLKSMEASGHVTAAGAVTQLRWESNCAYSCMPCCYVAMCADDASFAAAAGRLNARMLRWRCDETLVHALPFLVVPPINARALLRQTLLDEGLVWIDDQVTFHCLSLKLHCRSLPFLDHCRSLPVTAFP